MAAGRCWPGTDRATPSAGCSSAGGLLQAVAAAVPPVGGAAAGCRERRRRSLRLLITDLRLQLALGDRSVHPAGAAAVPRRPAGVPALAAGDRRWWSSPRRCSCWRWAPLRCRSRTAVRSATSPWPSTTSSQPLWFFAELRTMAAYLLALVALLVRYRRGREAVRRQLLWLLLALLAGDRRAAAWGLVAGTPVAVLFTVPLIPVAVTVAIVRYRLLDIRLVVSRAVAWLLLSLAVIVGLRGAGRRARPPHLLLAGPVGRGHGDLGAVAAPALPRLQRLVDRAMYGDRANPARVVSAARRGTWRRPRPDWPVCAGSIRQALRLPYVALETRRAPCSPPTASGRTTWSGCRSRYGGEVVGRLTVGLRDGERRLSRARPAGARTRSPRRWPSRCTPPWSPRSCRPRASDWSELRRRNAGGSAANCTTASGRP